MAVSTTALSTKSPSSSRKRRSTRALGHADCIHGHAQLGGDIAGRLVIDRGAPESLPALRREFLAKLDQGAANERREELCIFRVVRFGRRRGSGISSTALGLRAAGRVCRRSRFRQKARTRLRVMTRSQPRKVSPSRSRRKVAMLSAAERKTSWSTSSVSVFQYPSAGTSRRQRRIQTRQLRCHPELSPFLLFQQAE